ncbi:MULTISPECIES: ATP-binding protein [Streptosporangium]|uniref:DNA-binding CsgD family transcriptional regulator/tetratricopeptide (TPR) repeat protein n=1 Tax=Streptosporangium brasiliense TaxID=47480 RepID=A0ABT9REI0_9ACTN|nr:helix-turn-helix transcriptional regulator [Streptosporangium brasiliense]MDP9866795.1 DNA-binding CsgD family transcriptional regulator/tetratricopeptide (TPR) repeat protein [Streptosporangium brasiliense]
MELLEREDALAVLAECRREHGRVALVSGEAGIGKTALVTAFAAQVDGGVLWGGCDALRTPRPLGPLRDIARAAGGELARAMAAESVRYDRYGAFLDVLAAGRTVVIEDAHWADEATLDLLAFAGRRVGGTAGLLIITYRDDELGSHHPLLGVLGRLAGERSTRRIPLRPLSAAAVAHLAEPYGMDPREVHARTAGNPFFVTEVLGEPGPVVPVTVRDAVLARAARLDADARAVLDAVAVIPDHAELSLFDGFGGGDARTAIDACVRAGMLVGEGTGVRFRHELARLSIEQTIAPARRGTLHAVVLAWLAARPGSDPARLAYHAEEAGNGPAVLVHAPAAAERAAAAGAHRQAADHYTQALRFVLDPPSGQSAGLSLRERAELLERHADACARVDRDTAAIESSGVALELWQRIGDTDRQAALLARRSHYLWISGRTHAANDSVRTALAMIDPDRPGPALAAASTWSAALLMLARDIPGAIEVGTQAIALAEQVGDTTLLARALNTVGSAQWFADPEQAEPALLRSLEVARRAGDDAAAGGAMANLGAGAGEIRHYDLAECWLRECIAWCEQRGLDRDHRYATAWLGRVLFERGRWTQAADLLTASPPGRMAGSRIVTLTVLGRIRVRRGEPDGAAALEEAWELAVPTMDLQRLWPVAAGRAEAAYLIGRTADIPALVAETYGHAVRLGHRWAAGELGYWLHHAGMDTAGGDSPYALETTGDWRGAERAWEQLGCPYEAAVARAASPDAADLVSALDRLQRLGARPMAELIAQRLRALGVDRRPRRATFAHPAGLTSRELDVLALLREGLRNADIAARLHIADKTVDHHVSAILAKLGVRNRQEAARWKDGEAPRQS